jgi:hypothetical protein
MASNVVAIRGNKKYRLNWKLKRDKKNSEYMVELFG